MLNENLSINVTPGGVPVVIHISQYDVGLRTFIFAPYTSHGTFTPDAAVAATLEGTKPDGNIVVQNCQYNATTGEITYTVQEQLAAVVGKVWSKLTLRDTSGNAIGYAAIIWVVDMAGVQDGAIASDSDISALAEFINEFGTINAYKAALDGALAAVGGPYVASTVSQMTDRTKVYVYTGSQSGYTAGHWYYWNGSAWTDGGVYQAAAVETDKTLTVADMPADAKATGDAVAELKNELNLHQSELFSSNGTTWEQGAFNLTTGTLTTSANRCRTTKFFLKKGATFTINPNGMWYNFGIYKTDGTFTSYKASWTQDGNSAHFSLDYDANISVAVRLANDASITPTDVTATVSFEVSKIDTINTEIEPLIQDYDANLIKSITPLDFELGGIGSGGKMLEDRTARTDRARLKYVYRGIDSVTIKGWPAILTHVKKYDSVGNAIGVVDVNSSASGVIVDTSSADYIIVSCNITALSDLTNSQYRLSFVRDESFAQTGYAELTKRINDSNVFGSEIYTIGSLNQIARLGWHPTEPNYPPQQSIASYKLAYDNAVRMMLCDVRVTADGKYVCWHDADLSSSNILHSDGTALGAAEKTQLIADMTLAELDEYDFGLFKGSQYAGTKILRLTDFLAWCSAMNVYAVLEMKVRWTPAQIAEISRIIKSYKMHKRTVIAAYYNDLDAIPTDDTAKSYTYWISNLPKALYLVLSGQANWNTSLAIATAFVQADIQTFIGHMSPQDITREMFNAIYAQGIELFYGEITSETEMSNFYSSGYMSMYTLINSGWVRVLEWANNAVNS